MTMEYICREVRRIQKKYEEIDPAKVCQAMHIAVIYQSMGAYANACKAFYLMQSRKQAIVINSDLSSSLQRVLLSHELGHAVLHRTNANTKTFHDVHLFDETSQYEYEANLFAAEFLINDNDVITLLKEDQSFFAIASIISIPPALLDFKCRMLKYKGTAAIESPLMARSDFLNQYQDEGEYPL